VGINIGLSFDKEIKIPLSSIKEGLDTILEHSSFINYNFNVYQSDLTHAYNLPGDYLVHFQCNSSNNEIRIQSSRMISGKLKTCTDKVITETVVSLLAAIFIPELRGLTEQYTRVGFGSAGPISTLKYSSEYQLTFNLLIGNPNDALVSWEIDETIHKYINPFLTKVSNITQFAVSSQIQNYASLTESPPKVSKNGKSYFELNPKSISHYFNSAEWNLGTSQLTLASVVSSNPPIHFVIYVPSKINRFYLF
jgi:hypothetical protein